MKKILFAVMIFNALFVVCEAQNPKADKTIEKAVGLIKQKQETKATELLKDAIKSHPDYAPLYIFLGEIYFNQKDYPNSILYYNKGVSIDPVYDVNAYYRLGIMQKQTGDYTSARNNFSVFINKATKPRHKAKIKECEYNIACIDFILEQINTAKDFNPVNLGGNINDNTDQYLPTLMLDNTLYLTERKDNKEDFYSAGVNEQVLSAQQTLQFDKLWNGKQKLPPPLNTEANEGAASISPDGRYLYFTKCNTSDGYGSCDIYRSKRIGDSWSAPENLGPNVNSRSWDSQPSIASDGRTLFFASNREGGFGQSDIWYSYLKEDGTWTKAKNCGNVINTGGMEMSPFIHPSNTRLYFSSDSLIGMGSQDIYFSEIVNGKFTQPVNMGYPINTSADESCLIVAAGGEFAVYSKKNDDNNFDLYAFDLEKDLRPTKVICLQGSVVYDDNRKGNEAVFEVKNLKTNRLVTSTISDKTTDRYTLALVEGEDYAMSVTCDGYLLYSENFTLKDDANNSANNDNKTKFAPFQEKNINLKSIKEGNSVVLKNIFFATDSYELMEESNAELNTLLKLLNDNPKISVEIAGHTDDIGKEEYNLKLSQNRANSVMYWLIEKGISKDRLSAKGYGKTRPIADNSSEEGRKQNRRTEFKIVKSK